MPEIGGTVAPAFEAVRAAFARNFAEHDEVGGGCAVFVDGRKVVDLVGGVADVESGAPYGTDTIQVVFSATKGATAACANLLAQRGLVDLDAPVADCWPEFAKEGKGDIPVRWLLCHKAGLPYVDATLTLDEALAWDPMVAALEAQRPVWEPGTAHGYHATTFGWLVGEVVRRASGKSPGTFFADEIAGPLGLELWIGLPEHHEPRIAPLIATSKPRDPKVAARIQEFMGPDTMLGKALSAPSGVFRDRRIFNDRRFRAAELPAFNGVGNARSLARMYAGLVGGLEGGPDTGLLTAEQIAAASTTLTSGPDQVIFFDTTIGLGFWTSSPFAPYGGARSFGHAGAGGSVGFADPENGIGFGYVTTRMQQNISADPRSRGLIKAVYQSIGVEPAHV